MFEYTCTPGATHTHTMWSLTLIQCFLCVNPVWYGGGGIYTRNTSSNLEETSSKQNKYIGRRGEVKIMGLKNLTGLLLNVVCLREHLNLPGMFTIAKSYLVTRHPSYKVCWLSGAVKRPRSSLFLPFPPCNLLDLACFPRVSNFVLFSDNQKCTSGFSWGLFLW